MDLVFPRSTSSVIPQSELSNSGISGVFYSPCPTRIHFLVPTLTLEVRSSRCRANIVITIKKIVSPSPMMMFLCLWHRSHRGTSSSLSDPLESISSTFNSLKVLSGNSSSQSLSSPDKLSMIIDWRIELVSRSRPSVYSLGLLQLALNCYVTSRRSTAALGIMM